MLAPGESRKRLARMLTAAYADGLLSEETLNHRLDRALSPGVVDGRRLTGDLAFRRSDRPSWRVTRLAAQTLGRWLDQSSSPGETRPLLALDWTGATRELLIGRQRSCDVVLPSDAVSRRHARVFFRDGRWILQDLESTNGTLVNGVRVGRCRLNPGDRVCFGTEEMRID